MIVRHGQTIIDCVEARTPSQQAVGLSETASLPVGNGMLFVYEYEAERSFWMPKTMRFPIDIVFISDFRKVTKICEGAQPGSRNRSVGRARHVLEVPAGFCQAAGIRVGSYVEFEEETEHASMQSSDVLRSLTTAQSTESEPYQRAPSVAPSDDRFQQAAPLSDQVGSDSLDVSNGPLRDDTYGSPTRSSRRS
jgi:uncharacterized membrane protein (UPF0127 family)